MGIALIAGLGNPGQAYARTRHNVGFQFIDRLAEQSGMSLRRETRFVGELARWAEAERECWLLKPLTYMNLSGDSVAALMRYYRLSEEQLLVVHDELDLPPGTVRLKRGGGDGGHNGLSDIIAKLATDDFYRLRIGIGHPGARELVTPYLLHSRPEADEQSLIDESLARAIEHIPRLVAGDMTRVMNALNRRKRNPATLPPAEQNG